MKQTKPYKIPKSLLYEAYQRVKANKGGSGVDGQSLQAFDQDLSNNLYKLWNLRILINLNTYSGRT